MTYPRSWLGFTTMCLGLFMAILDLQIVASALPRIATSLRMPLDQLSWVQTAYLITEVIAIAVSGRLTRALSTRWLYSSASLGFVLTSLGCALSHDFVSLIAFRTFQGFFAGTIIPTVFATGYKMFPKELKARAILIAGAVAMFAPSIGPFVGGYIADKLSWNWLFLINIPIGLAVAAIVATVIRVDEPDPSAWRTIDAVAFVALSVSLGTLETLLKVAPEDHWTAARDYGLLFTTLATGAVFVWRCRHASDPLVDFSPMRKVSFSVGCALNFVLGMALFGAIYALPLFLGFVRFHTPLEIGVIMTVMGVSQLLAAPLATVADKRLPATWVVAFGFALFAAGAFANAFQTPTTDFSGLLVPQILRGTALLFCILPITNVSLGQLQTEELSNGSALLNLLRNLGGAVGIGLVDTIVNVRPHAIAQQLVNELVHGSAATAAFVGIPANLLAGVDISRADPADVAFVRPIIERAAATIAFNEAWLMLGAVLALSLLLAPLLRRTSTTVRIRSFEAATDSFPRDAATVS